MDQHKIIAILKAIIFWNHFPKNLSRRQTNNARHHSMLN